MGDIAQLDPHQLAITAPHQPASPPELDAAAWDELVEAMLTAQPEDIAWSEPTPVNLQALIVATMAVIIPWLTCAPLGDLLALRAPADPALTASPAALALPDPQLLFEYRWAVERFALTQLAEWNEQSLLLEHRWMSGAIPGPCPQELMVDRVVDQERLNAEIAGRRAAGTGPDTMLERPSIRPSLAHKMRQRAIALLEAGRFREAATLFEFALDDDPSDVAATNNLGFCLVPHQPREALEHLRRAYELGYRPLVINLHNRAVCHVLLGEPRMALALITAAWDEVTDESAVLWVGGREDLWLAKSASSRRELARLALQVAGELGDDSLPRWRAIVTGLDERHTGTDAA